MCCQVPLDGIEKKTTAQHVAQTLVNTQMEDPRRSDIYTHGTTLTSLATALHSCTRTPAPVNT